jgi:hypothetical protein
MSETRKTLHVVFEDSSKLDKPMAAAVSWTDSMEKFSQFNMVEVVGRMLVQGLVDKLSGKRSGENRKTSDVTLKDDAR